MKSVDAPFRNPGGDLRDIEGDRKAIAGETGLSEWESQFPRRGLLRTWQRYELAEIHDCLRDSK
jgi:hypothetical protein